MASFGNSNDSRGRPRNKKEIHSLQLLDILILPKRVIFLPLFPSIRKVPLFASIAVFLFKPLVYERFKIEAVIPIYGA